MKKWCDRNGSGNSGTRIRFIHMRETLCYTPVGMKPNLDHLSAALRQVGIVVTATGLVTGVFNADQAPLSLGITLGGLALIWAASLED